MVAETTTVVETFNLQKTYRSGFWLNRRAVSLKCCSLQVFRGETFGLLGPNGAGKTTLLKLLLGIARPTAGYGQVLSQPLGCQSVKCRIGYLPENPYFYDFLTGWELLKFAAGLFQIPRSIWRRRIPELLDLVGLAQSTARKKQLRQYSKGMLQRIGMAQALINDPELVFLDEPMSGLDPLGRCQIRSIILSLKQQGKTIFFNSHILSDVEMICDRIAILTQGEILCMGKLEALLGLADSYWVKGQGGNQGQLQDILINLQVNAGDWQGYWRGSLYELVDRLRLTNAQILSLRVARPTLEEFFIQQTRQRSITASQ